MKRISFLTAVLLLVAALLLLASCGEQPQETPKESQSADSSPSDSQTEPQQSDTEPATEPPTETQEPQSQEPVTEPDTEEASSADDPGIVDPEDPNQGGTSPADSVPVGTVYAKGQFTSKESNYIALVLDWSLTKQANGSVLLSMTASLSTYDISSRPKPNLGTFIAGNESKTFSTPQIDYTGSGRTLIPLATETFELTGTEEYLPLSASWKMMGYYHGQEIDSLVAVGVIDLLDLPAEYLVH